MKNQIRKKYLLIRKNIIDKELKSELIFNKIINNDIYKKSKVIALYNSMTNEVDTKKLINYSINNKKTVLLPKVNKDKMYFYQINEDTKYQLSNFGVEEPICNNIYNKQIDLVIVPIVVFDSNCNRIGYGKGYYDKYLSDKNITTIGIAFAEQQYNNIPIEEHDKKLNLIITNKQTYYKK